MKRPRRYRNRTFSMPGAALDADRAVAALPWWQARRGRRAWAAAFRVSVRRRLVDLARQDAEQEALAEQYGLTL